MDKLTEIELKLDGRILAEGKKQCWQKDAIGWYYSRYEPCASGELIAAVHPRFPKHYILLCKAHLTRSSYQAWGYEEIV